MSGGPASTDTDIRGKVAIVGVGHTPQGELPGQSPELNAVLAIKIGRASCRERV